MEKSIGPHGITFPSGDKPQLRTRNKSCETKESQHEPTFSLKKRTLSPVQQSGKCFSLRIYPKDKEVFFCCCYFVAQSCYVDFCLFPHPFLPEKKNSAFCQSCHRWALQHEELCNSLLLVAGNLISKIQLCSRSSFTLSPLHCPKN